MKKVTMVFSAIALWSHFLFAQSPNATLPCSEEAIIKRQLVIDSNALLEDEANRVFVKEFVEKLQAERAAGTNKQQSGTYIIPVVIHVFHNGNDGKVDSAQIQSGLDVLNADMKGLNGDFNSISPLFDSIKSTLDIEFRLAKIDPFGNPTTGVNYYDDSLAMLNQTDLFVYAWDNFKYMNIFMPKYTGGSFSLFTAFTYYPSLAGSNQNKGGMFYSSIRWGYGAHSILIPGQEWASVVTHEMGHWLNLRHTFENGCSGTGDNIADTPPCTGGTIYPTGCFNNDSTCGVSVNGENYMDYNHDCKKMFTQGQVDAMTAALNFNSRNTLWSESNLIATGLLVSAASISESERQLLFNIYPNPATDVVQIESAQPWQKLLIFDFTGRLVYEQKMPTENIDLSKLPKGIYNVKLVFKDGEGVNRLVKL